MFSHNVAQGRTFCYIQYVLCTLSMCTIECSVQNALSPQLFEVTLGNVFLKVDVGSLHCLLVTIPSVGLLVLNREQGTKK